MLEVREIGEMASLFERITISISGRHDALPCDRFALLDEFVL